MPTPNSNKRKTETSVPLNFRIKPSVRNLIDRAAEVVGKHRTDFVIEAAERRAEEVLLDQTIFTVPPEAYAEFLARLDAPPQPNEKLKRMMNVKAPWDKA